MKSTNKCMVPECEREQVIRGLCQSHYQFACRLIKEKSTTWEELEKNKKILPPKRRGIKNNVRNYFILK